MSTNPYPTITIRAGTLLPALRARAGDDGSLPAVTKRDLSRYYEMLERSLPTFEPNEASLIVDVLNGTVIEPASVSLLWADVQEAIQHDGLAEKWEVDGAGLVNRLAQMTPFEQMAIADAAERFWRLDNSDRNVALRRAGLVK